MKTFIMLVGCSGSGKSTWAKEYIETSLVKPEIISTDNIRAEICGDAADQSKNKEVFQIAHERIKNSKADAVVYDATNMTIKDRAKALACVPQGVACFAKVFPIHFNAACKRQEKRSRRVPAEVIWRQICKFQIPIKREGFEDIEIFPQEIDRAFHEAAERMIGFDQKNSHHSLSLYDHCIKTYMSISPHGLEVWTAARYHDIGKLYTQVFVNSKGKPTEEAHYYNHENVGAYYLLAWGMNSDVAALVNYHMEPYNCQTEKAVRRRIAIFGEELWNKILILHEADKAAH